MPQQRQVPRQSIIIPKPAQKVGPTPNLQAIEEQKNFQRKRLFEPFNKGKTEEKTSKPEETEPEKSEQKEAKEKPKEAAKKSKRITQTKKQKEDVFLKLKAMAQEAKKKPGKKNVPK